MSDDWKEQLKIVLHKTTSADQVELNQAFALLEDALKTDFGNFTRALAALLNDANNTSVCRQQAGIQLKNLFYSKEENKKIANQQRWMTLSKEVRMKIKQDCVEALGTETTRPSQAAQCVGFIAITELSMKEWMEIVPFLAQQITMDDSKAALIEACLEALGYICQDLEPEHLESSSSAILTAIVHGLRRETETNEHVKIAAAKALLNAIEFCRANFKREEERDVIMTVVCEMTQLPKMELNIISLEILVRIIATYYEHMEKYMNVALVPITIMAIKSKEDQISLQGIEFWSTLNEMEWEFQQRYMQIIENGGLPEKEQNLKFAKNALGTLMPALLSRLLHDDEEEEDEFTPSKSVCVCLQLISRNVESDILSYILPFLENHIRQPNWQSREAAINAFSCIMEGPEPTQIFDISKVALPLIIEYLSIDQMCIRDAAIWAVNCVCKFVPQVATNNAFVAPMLEGLLKNLDRSPRATANACWALSDLFRVTYMEASGIGAAFPNKSCEDERPNTYVFSENFDELFRRLLIVSDRNDGNRSNLRTAAYQAIMNLLRYSPNDCYRMVKESTTIMIERLEQIMNIDVTSGNYDINEICDIESLLCATVQMLLRRLKEEDIIKLSEKLLQKLAIILSPQYNRSNGVQEEAFSLLSCIIETLNEDFVQYFPQFKNSIFAAVAKTDETQLVIAAIGVATDITRCVTKYNPEIAKFYQEFMQLLLQIIDSPTLDQSVKPHIIESFGDFCPAMKNDYSPFLQKSIEILGVATMASSNETDEDILDYFSQLLESICAAFSGIIQSIQDRPSVEQADKEKFWLMIAPTITTLIKRVFTDHYVSERVILGATGLIGDAGNVFGKVTREFCTSNETQGLVERCRKIGSPQANSLIQWTIDTVAKLG
ncbi:hypothetical protein SNEBB_009233 [Seison nebaliae]|nr:hypothetical protein SNEBB_009233 [Seison nebaliae]